MSLKLIPVPLGLALTLTLFTISQLMGYSSSCVRVSAAFYFKTKMYFIIGDRLLGVDKGNNIVSRNQMSEFDPFHVITAAVGFPDAEKVHLFSDSAESENAAQVFVGFGDPLSKSSVIEYWFIEKVFNEGNQGDFHGVDAAIVDPWNYVDVLYFSGCNYISIDPNRSKLKQTTPIVRANRDLGLPCDLDAALFSPIFGRPIAIKGDQVWLVEPRRFQFSGPVDIKHVLLALNHFTFCRNTV